MGHRARALGRRETVEYQAGRRCEYCRAPQPVSGVRYHLDHILPESLGGTDSIENLALACPTCNYHKSNHLFGLDEQGFDDRPLLMDQLTQKFETELTKKLSDSDKANMQVIVNFDPEIK